MPTVRTGLADQVVERLLRDIIEAVYPPGGQLPPEPVLAEQAGVSRLTLREAVKALRQQGVVRVEQGRGTFVNPPSQWQAFDAKLLLGLVAHDRTFAMQLTEVRQIVEVGAASLAAKRRKAADLVEMRDAIQRMKDAQSAGDMMAFSQADLHFHRAVLDAAGNYFVPALLAPIEAGLMEVRIQTSQERRMNERTIVMHTRIYEAIRERTAPTAGEVMSRHLDETKKYIEDISE
jgi:GntR family transcriptional regulator, transcriptional repressor for pyruvate dehydrogenase complex